MGKWNRRWIPRRKYTRKKYQDYVYEEPPPSPPSPHHPQSNPPAIQETKESSWEIEFCKSVRVPWKKVITAKKYMYCYDNVVKWDDAAAVEAFHDAKRRYWEKINRLPCETPLPDQGMYTDEIDWNPNIDVGLISELDKEYFNPDEVGESDKMEARVKEIDNPVPGCAMVRNYENPDNLQNPWESAPAQGVRNLKDALPNWGQCTESINSKSVRNPWEQGGTAVDESNAWKGSADMSWSWNQEQKYNKQATGFNNNSNNFVNGGCRELRYTGEKGQSHIDDSPKGWKQWNVSAHVQQNLVKTGNNWQRSLPLHSAASSDRGWRDCGNVSWNWKQSEDQNKLPRNQDLRRPPGDGRGLQSGCRKREGSFQHQSRYKTYRFQGRWQKEKSQEKIDFYA